MGMSDEARALREVNKTLRMIVAELVEMNEQLDEKARRSVMVQLGGLDIPESCPKERRWTAEPAATAACNTCRRFWSCPFLPGQDPKGGK